MNLLSYIYGYEFVQKFAHAKPNTFLHLRIPSSGGRTIWDPAHPDPREELKQGKTDTDDYKEEATPLLQMIWAHGPGGEASHSIFGSKSGAPGHIVVYHTLDNQGPRLS